MENYSWLDPDDPDFLECAETSLQWRLYWEVELGLQALLHHVSTSSEQHPDVADQALAITGEVNKRLLNILAVNHELAKLTGMIKESRWNDWLGGEGRKK